MERLARHPNMGGLKDSSGDPDNLDSYRAALPADKALYVGDETLLLRALRAGWTGAISGAANVVPQWLSTIEAEWREGNRDSSVEKFKILLPALEGIRNGPQPAANKAVLARYSVISRGDVRLPLETCPPEVAARIADTIRLQTGA